MADSINLLKLPGYNDISNILLDRIFKAVLLPMLKELIQERVSSFGFRCTDTILKQHHHDDILPRYIRPKFKFDKMQDFRFAMKIVSDNNIGCFSEKEVELCDKLRKMGNHFVHTSEISTDFVIQVMTLTEKLLSFINTTTDIDITNYSNLLKDSFKLLDNSNLSM